MVEIERRKIADRHAVEEILVSVVIPAYNVEKCIRKSVASILSQTHRNLEVIVVLNGCTDESLSVCRAIANKDARVRVVENEVKGALQARKRGVLEARGQYITFVDADDIYVKSNTVKCMLDSTVESGSQICQFGMFIELPLGFRVKSPKSKRSETTAVEIYNFPERRDDVFVGIAMGWFSSFTQMTPDKMYAADVLKDAVQRVRENFFYGDDSLLNAYVGTSPNVRRAAIYGGAYYLYMRGGGSSKYNGYEALRETREWKESLACLVASNNMGEIVSLRMHSQSLCQYREIVQGMIRRRFCKEEVLAAIEDAETFPHIIAAKEFFANRADTEGDLKFMCGSYTPEEYYKFCADSTPSRLAFFASRLASVLERK